MTRKSQEAVTAALSAVLRDHGWAVAGDAKRLRAALSDVLGADADEHRGVLDSLVVAADEGVVDELREAGREGVESVLPGQVERLAGWGLAPDLAAWAVRAWAAQLPETTLAPQPTPAVAWPAEEVSVTAEPPETWPRVVAPTTLPPASTTPSRVSPAADPVLASADLTVIPESLGQTNGPAHERPRVSGRGAVVVAAVVGVVLVAGGVAAAVPWSGTAPEARTPEASRSASAFSQAGASPTAPPPPADAGDLVVADGTRVPVAERRPAMAARTGGVRIAALGEVETVGIGEQERSAPDGGRLIAFRVVDWPCERGSCRSWSTLGLEVAVGTQAQRLPREGGADTFVVAVPAAARKVDLVMKVDGTTQSLSLLTGEAGRKNIAVLARSGRVDRIGERFTLTEQTSVAFDYGDTTTDTVPRNVTVSRA